MKSAEMYFSRTSLLARAIPSGNPIEIIKLYAVVQNVYWRFRNSTWKFPHALLKKEQRGIFERVDFNEFGAGFVERPDFPEVFNSLYKDIIDAEVDLKSFVLEVLPDFVAQPDLAFDLLEKVRVIEYRCLALILAKNEYFGVVETMGNYSIARRAFSEVEWTSLVCAVNCYPFDYESKLLGAAHNAHKILVERNCTEEFQIEVYSEVREFLVGSWAGKQRKWRSKIVDPAHYIRGVHGHNPKFDLFDMDEAINAAAVHMGNIEKPTDFLEAVLVNKFNNDSKIENGFVALKFFTRLSDEDTILVVNPSPDFLCQYPEKFLSATTFVVMYKSMAWVLEHQFPEAKFICFEEFGGEELLSNADEERSVFTKALYFSRQLNAEEELQLLCGISSTLKETGTFWGVLSSSHATGEGFLTGHEGGSESGSYGRRKAARKFFLIRVDLLPLTAFSSSPKKKVFVEASLTEPAEEFVRMMDHEFLEESGKKSHLRKMSVGPILVLRQELATTPRSVYTVYRQHAKRLAESTGKQKKPHSVSFSKEIDFWYKVSKRDEGNKQKVEAYTCYLPSETQKKRRMYTRGEKVKGAYASIATLTKQEEIENWCKTVMPFRPRIHQGVVKVFDRPEGKRLLKSGGVSTKTLWYLRLDIQEKKVKKNAVEIGSTGMRTDPKEQREFELFCSPVGDLVINARQEEFFEAMQSFCNGKEIEETAFFWNCLNNLIKYAQNSGYIRENPVEVYAKEFREKRDTSILDVRAALAKKTFRHEEEKLLLDYLFTVGPENGEYLSVLIRFFTGLEPNIVSALIWDDIHKVADGVYQFWIYQQFANGGEKPVPLENDEDYRRIPIAPVLYEKLQERLSKIKKETNFGSRQLGKIQIVATNAQLKQETMKKVTPRRINDLSREAIKRIHIADNLVDLPDLSEEKGTKETNLSSYRGDIFRAHIRYRMIECGFTDSEIRYVLGLCQTSPFGKNYCDYLNSFSQLALFYKFCRWDATSFGLAETQFWSKKLSMTQEIVLHSGYTKASTLIEIPISAKTGALSAEIKAEHGFHVQAVLIRECGSDDDAGTGL